MYSPYSSTTQRNKSRLYLVLFLSFIALIVYWKYYSSPQKQTFKSAGEQIDSVIQKGNDKVDNVVNGIKDAANKAVDAAKDTVKKSSAKIATELLLMLPVKFVELISESKPVNGLKK